MFVWKNGELNPEQESAIFNENSVLLIACPGSGKTRTLTGSSSNLVVLLLL